MRDYLPSIQLWRSDKMKQISILFSLMIVSLALEAKSLKLTKEQLEDWQIQTTIAEPIEHLPLGRFMAEVVTPPQYLYTISLPFEAQIKSLHVANYDQIKKGQILADVTGNGWIEIQQQFIEDSIELKHHKHLAKRKNRLCKEEIIPKKECMAASAEYRADKIKVASAKALLRGFGADEKHINRLFQQLKITQTIPVRSSVSGKLLELNVRAGETTQPSKSLFVIQKEGALWLEAEILIQSARALKDEEHVTLDFAGEKFESKVLLHAPKINLQNQTQKVRFSLPNSNLFVTGLRDMLTISKSNRALKIPKESVISLGGAEVVFVQNERGFEAVSIKVLGEESRYYFVKTNAELKKPIVKTSVAILKSMMESEDE